MTSSPAIVSVTTDAGAMPAQMWLPESGSGPGIVVLQEIFGVSAYIQRRAQDLADRGFVVLAPQIYWRLDLHDPFEGDDALERGFATLQTLDWDAAVADGAASVRALRALPQVDGPVGIVGFCFGGGLGFNVAAVEPVDALVSYYGSALPGLLDLAPQVSAPSLHHFGTADSFIDTETVERIRAAVLPQGAQFETYPGADHAFDNDDAPWFHAQASALAWPRTTVFLDEHLR